MSRSRKKTPISTICVCMSQRQDKKIANRTFRRTSKLKLKLGKNLPMRLREVSNVWDWVGDGKCYFHKHKYDDLEWFERIMRK